MPIEDENIRLEGMNCGKSLILFLILAAAGRLPSNLESENRIYIGLETQKNPFPYPKKGFM